MLFIGLGKYAAQHRFFYWNIDLNQAIYKKPQPSHMQFIRQVDDAHLKIKLAKMSAGILNRAIPVCRLNTK